MRMTRRQFAALAAAPLLSAAGDDSFQRRAWTAKWIAPAGAPPYTYCVCHFRRAFDLPSKPERFPVHVSADNRYQLFVNGKRVCEGPARGDLFHWRYETVDLAPYLTAGRNAIAALIWNFGELAPEAQITLQTAFVLQGDTAAEQIVDSGSAWKAIEARSYSPLVFTTGQMRGYFVAGPGDRVDAGKHLWGWEQSAFDDSAWKPAAAIAPAAGRDASDVHSRWMLVARPIPPMRETPSAPLTVRRATGIAVPRSVPSPGEPLTIPPNTTATLLLDQSFLTTGYPELIVSAGAGSTVRLRYAETLFRAVPGQRRLSKGKRDEIEGKEFLGYHDEFIADGASSRTFRPLWWRTWRYLELAVETKAEPLTISSLTSTESVYPFERRARFDAGSPELAKILDTGWRTAALCAHETYMDCPYYEQLQYGGDTRVQGLISIFNTGDARLLRNAIDLLNDSRLSEGCTQSRYPTRLEQYIPAWTMWWVGMVHDYYRYVDDPSFVRRMIPGVRAVVSFFDGYRKENGSLGPLPWWRNFDWVQGWPNGDAPQDADGSSAPFDLLMVLVYQWAADLESSLGLAAMAAQYRARARQLQQTCQTMYWDPSRRMYADTSSKKLFSQHSNTLAVLAGVIDGAAARDLMLRTVAAKDIAQAALFFRFYVHVALTQVGEGDTYLDRLGDWRDMIAHGLTTFSETADNDAAAPPRSDCHAWSASPNIEIFRNVLGVDSAAPGFSRVRVAPHPGKLSFVSGSVPHPKGAIEVSLKPVGSAWSVSIDLPPGIPGEFEWRGSRRELRPGANTFRIG